MFELTNVQNRMKNVSQAIIRYPLTIFIFIILFLLSFVAVQSRVNIEDHVLYSLLLAGFLTVVAQHMYERFFHQLLYRWGLQVGAMIIAGVYYFLLLNSRNEFVVITIRTSVLLFALGIFSMWILTYQREMPLFHQMVVAYVKAFLVTLLYSLTLFLGVNAILGSYNTLISTVPYTLYSHVGNAVLYLFAPIVFLGGIPLLRESLSEQESNQQRFLVPRVLEILLSYLLIPIMVVYTVILLLYIVLNFGGGFWQDNLLEPLLVLYAIGIIIIYLLACNVSNPVSNGFRRIFPKVLLPIVLLQTVASIFKIGELGITHGRYYVILFGVFATFAAVLFSFFEKEKNGLLAPVLIVLALISVIPPIDAFSVATSNQASRLTRTLEQNQMIQGTEVVAKSDISGADRRTISQAVLYLYEVDAIDEVPYLPDGYDPYRFFESKFGFTLQPHSDGTVDSEYDYAYLNWETVTPMLLEENTYLARLDTYTTQRTVPLGDEGEVHWDLSNDSFVIEVRQNDAVVLDINMNPFLDEVFQGNPQNVPNTAKDLTRTYENEQVTVVVLAENLERANGVPQAQLFLFVTFN